MSQELAGWIRNNWRPYETVAAAQPRVKVTAINVVWEMHRAAVEEQLKILLDVEELDPSDVRCFQQRTTAAKRVLDGMTEVQRAEINAVVEQRRSQGHPIEVQREYICFLFMSFG